MEKETKWKLRPLLDDDACSGACCVSVVDAGPCFGENCFKLLALAVGIMRLKIACRKIALLKKEKKPTNQQNLTVEEPGEL